MAVTLALPTAIHQTGARNNAHVCQPHSVDRAPWLEGRARTPLRAVVSPDSFRFTALRETVSPHSADQFSLTLRRQAARGTADRAQRWPVRHAPHRVAVLAFRSAVEDSDPTALALSRGFN